ncbi:MAG: FAD-dependent oxidoreductase [Pseudomonadota bacterium]
MNIAIIGAGIAGLTSAYTLSRRHRVTVFEAGHYAGGHANTVDVEDAGKTIPVDTGFIVFNRPNYPSLCRLFEHLGVASHDSDMSFAVRCERTGREWNGGSMNQVFAQRRNLMRPSHWRMLRDILRFHDEAESALETLDDQITVETWIDTHGYSTPFAQYYLLPLGASLWSCSAGHFERFPMRFVLEFLRNHHMLQVNDRPVWRTVTGGSREYVKQIIQPFYERLHLNCPVAHVRRAVTGVDVTLANGHQERFDEVILACHADQALRLLAEPDAAEHEILSHFPYQQNTAVLHTDESLLPRRKRAWASWNFTIPAQASDAVNVTYNMNLLQKLDARNTWCVTLNPGSRIDPAHIARRFVYDHPMFTPGRSEAQARHAELVRRRGISYCGAYWGFGFHEDGARSALDVCAAFDADLRLAA